MGCTYRKGPIVSTVMLKVGKALRVVAGAADLGIPLDADPRPVRISVRHGAVMHCFEFGGEKGRYRPDRKLLARNASAATACPDAGSPGGAFVP